MRQPAISLHQPWASLCVTRQPCDCKAQQSNGALALAHEQPGCSSWSMVKRFETRSWPCPPKLIGSRILIHATNQWPTHEMRIGGYEVWHLGHHLPVLSDGLVTWPLPLGAIVGSATIEACYPIVHPDDTWDELPEGLHISGRKYERIYLCNRGLASVSDISDQLPYGDYRPGRYAWLLTDAAPTTERCPKCRGTGKVKNPSRDPDWGELHLPCPVCDGAGRCDPIPAKGHQGIWYTDLTEETS